MEFNDNDLRKLQLTQLKILKEVHRICEKHNIKYFLSDGTLIGAIRHKGFIPWDDDLDIGMLREDYLKFCSVCKYELSKEYFLQTMYTDPEYANIFGKILLNDTICILNDSHKLKCRTGIYLDIFPFDNIPNKKIYQKLYYKTVIFFKKCYQMKKGFNIYFNNTFKGIIKKCLFCFVSFFPSVLLRYLLNYTVTFFTKYYKKNCLLVSKYFSNTFFKYIINIECLSNLTLFPFENDMYYVPVEYHKFLTNIYGDYMTPPPPNERINHNICELKFKDE